jgi:outer membrane beta-barrel protein
VPGLAPLDAPQGAVTVISGRILRGLILVLALGVPLCAQADDIEDAEDTGQLAAVQHRKYREAHELQIAFVGLPLDAFYKGIGIEGGYTWHFSDRWAWEVVHAGYAYDMDTGLKTELQQQFKVAPTAFEIAKYYINSDIVLKPLYMKASFFNHTVVHGEIFVLGGGGIFDMSSGLHPAANLGLGLRFYLSPRVSVRVDARDNGVFIGGTTGLKQVLAFSLGLSFDFGAD